MSNELFHHLMGQRVFGFMQSSRVMPAVARSVLALWLAPVGMAVLASLMLTGNQKPAHAQTAIQPVVVLDFSVEAGTDPILGRKAADALAVELQRSGDYEVIPRQQVEAAVQSQPGLMPPYNDSTQQRLAGAVGARSVFSGRVVRSIVTDRKVAKAQLEVRQLDAATGDYVNGAQIAEVTNDKLQEVDNDVLVDEAINKAAYTAVRAMKQTSLPEGTVLNVTRKDVETNLGARSGVAIGQKYSVLRDVFNKSRNITERVKVGEVTITNVEADQSTAVVSGGGQSGVRTGDKVRQIFVPSAVFPSSATSSSSNPVSAPPPATRSGTPSVIKKGGNTLLGLLALAGLVGLAGFGGGSSGNRADVDPPTNVRAVPSSIGGRPAVNVDYRAGLPGILAGQYVQGYLIFRGTSPNFAATAATLHDFVRGGQTTYADDATTLSSRTVEITEVNPDTNDGTGSRGRIDISETTNTSATDNEITQDAETITLTFTNRPLTPGVQYYYRVIRVTAVASEVTDTGGNNNNQTTDTVINLQPVLSNPSAPSGGATAILQPAVTASNGNLSAFTVTINAANNTPLPNPTPGGTPIPQTGTVAAGIDQFVVQVSTASNFPTDNRFEINLPNPGADASGNVVLNVGNIRVPNFETGDQLFVRVGARNTTDNPGATIFSPAFLVSNATNNASIASRFLTSGNGGRQVNGIGLPGRSGGGLGRSGGGRRPQAVLRPR